MGLRVWFRVCDEDREVGQDLCTSPFCSLERMFWHASGAVAPLLAARASSVFAPGSVLTKTTNPSRIVQ